jgi:hypothetical protein
MHDEGVVVEMAQLLDVYLCRRLQDPLAVGIGATYCHKFPQTSSKRHKDSGVDSIVHFVIFQRQMAGVVVYFADAQLGGRFFHP